MKKRIACLESLLNKAGRPFNSGDVVGIKLHWGEIGNERFLHADYAKTIVKWLFEMGAKPYVFDTTVLYSGGRRDGAKALETAEKHNFSQKYLGCPVIVADGFDGTDVVNIDAGFKHFESVQTASLVNNTDKFLIFSHFKGHLLTSFGGAIKNISMGFSSRAQKQRMHADAYPVLKKSKCTLCGVCVNRCPTGAALFGDDNYPEYDLQKCIGCAECIGLCPQVALKVMWNTDETTFQEKLIETAAAVWTKIAGKTVFINALIQISTECDCMPGPNPLIAEDFGFIYGTHPVAIDRLSLDTIGSTPFSMAHPNLPWIRQFEYARELGFWNADIGDSIIEKL
jgi:uncharacterized protein